MSFVLFVAFVFYDFMENNMNRMPLRVLIVDDSAFNRRTLAKLLESHPDIYVAGTTHNGKEALKAVERLKPDLVLLDLEMPEMDGFTFLRILMKTNPIPVIVVSSRDGDRDVFKAMELGAVDFIPKPIKQISNKLFDIKETLLCKILSIPHLKLKSIEGALLKEEKAATPTFEKETLPSNALEAEAVAIGASAGGPPAIHWILSQIPKPLPIPIVISQHMPPGFTNAFAERLDKDCPMEVKEACDGKTVQGGKVLIAPGGWHLTFKKRGGEITVRLIKGRQVDKYIPSIDLMFESAASIWGRQLIGIVLTGMGSDGARGAAVLKEKGGYCIAESEDTAIISSMPQAVISSGSADEVLPVYGIGARMARLGSKVR